MNDERERAIRERLAAATPGEWSWDKHYTLLRTDKPPFEAYPNEVEILDAWYYPENGDPIAADVDVRPTDAALIANAPADLAFLLARVDTLTRERDAARTALRNIHNRDKRSAIGRYAHDVLIGATAAALTDDGGA